MKRDVELLLLKLADGGRILRFSEPQSGLYLEKRLDTRDPVVRQKARWKAVLVAMLERELGTAGRSTHHWFRSPSGPIDCRTSGFILPGSAFPWVRRGVSCGIPACHTGGLGA